MDKIVISLCNIHCFEDRDCIQQEEVLDSFGYGHFDKRGEAAQIQLDSSRAKERVESRGP